MEDVGRDAPPLSGRTTVARLPYLSPDDLPGSERELLDRPINLFRALAHSPDGLRPLQAMGEWIRHGSRLDPRLRELAILQVAWCSVSAYAFSHHVLIARQNGVTDRDIDDSVADAQGQPNGLHEDVRCVLQAARELAADTTLADDTWRRLEKCLDNEQLVDLVLVITYYAQVVRVLGALRIDVEDEFSSALERFPLPLGGEAPVDTPGHRPR